MDAIQLDSIKMEQLGDLIEKVSGIAALITAISESGNVNIKAIDVLSDYAYTVKEELEDFFNGLQE